jgi:hypothetical protein
MFGDNRRNGTITSHRHHRVIRPANVLAAVVGLLSIALGISALIRTGLNTDHIFTPTREVLGLPHTPTLALAEIGFGIVLLLAAMMGSFGTFLVAILGAVSLAFGIIVLSESWSDRVHRWTAANHDTGWLFILVGAVFVLTAIAPLLVSRRPAPPRDTVAPEPAPESESESEPEPVAADGEPTVERAPVVASAPPEPEDRRPVPVGAAARTETTSDTPSGSGETLGDATG